MKKWLIRHCPTFTRLYVWWRDHLTNIGKILSLAMLVALPTLADADAAWAIVFLAGAALLLVTSMTSFLFRPHLGVRVACPEGWTCSTTRVVPITITNLGRRPVYDLEIDLLPVAGIWDTTRTIVPIPALAPGAATTVHGAVRALRRGQFALPKLRATTLFPLQLIRRGTLYPLPRHPLILPNYRPLRSFSLARPAPNQTRGVTLSFQTVGMNGEYVGSREYQPGMPVRKWDYPSWARLGQPVVREYCAPRHPATALVLDTAFPEAAGAGDQPIPELEALLSLAAATAEALLQCEYGIELLVVGDQLLFVQSSSLHDGHRLILEHLALAEPLDIGKAPAVADQLERLPMTWDIAIVMSHQWAARQERLFHAATRHRVAGKRIVVHDGATAPPPESRVSTCRVTCSEVVSGNVDI